MSNRMTLRRPVSTGYSLTLPEGQRYGYGPEGQFFRDETYLGPEFTPVAQPTPLPLPGERDSRSDKQKAAELGSMGALAGGFLLPQAAKAIMPDGVGRGDLLESLHGSGGLQLGALSGLGAGAGHLIGNLAGGADVEDVVASSVGSGLGTFAGGALGSFLGPIGTVAGSAVGGFVGDKVGGFIDDALFDRVICSTLWKLGYLTRHEVLIDLSFTKKRLTTAHVAGYHLWAYRVADELRRGRWIKTWQFIARRRSKELAYQLGYSTRPDYVGKIIRHVMEPACYLLGKLKEMSDGRSSRSANVA